MQLDITTAVDSLVELVSIKKIISVEDAAKELGLPEHIVNEWATFLQDEHILKIEYKFTTPYLVTIKKGAIIKKSELATVKEVLTRKVELMLSSVKKFNVQHSIKIESSKDVKSLLKKKMFEKTKLTTDFVYAQQIVLIDELTHLISKISKITENNKQQLFRYAQKLAKWRRIFEDNVAKISI